MSVVDAETNHTHGDHGDDVEPSHLQPLAEGGTGVVVAVWSLAVNVGMRGMGGGGLLIVNSIAVAVEEPTTVMCAGSARSCRSRGCVGVVTTLTENSVVGSSRVTGGGGIHVTSIVCTAVADAVMTNSTTMTNTIVVTDVVVCGGHRYVIAGTVGMSCSISSTTTGEIGKETHH